MMQTTTIVLEAAHFTRKSASGCARRLWVLHTESSQRFERGVDPHLPVDAIQRATDLVIGICGGQSGPVNEQKNESALSAKSKVTIRAD